MTAQIRAQKLPLWRRIFAWGGLALLFLVMIILSPFVYLNFKNYFADCAVEDRAARAYLVDALDAMQEHSINANKTDWSKLRQRACETATSARTSVETYPSISGAIAALKDGHSYLQLPTTQSAPFANANALVMRVYSKIGADTLSMNAAEPSQSLIDAANALPEGERYTVERHGFTIPNQRMGYLALDGFTSTAPANMLNYADTLSRAVDRVLPQSQCGVVVDLRRNTGGVMHPQFLGLHRLYGADNLMGTRERDGKERWISLTDRSYCQVLGAKTSCLLRLPASSLPQPDARTLPVAVLISGTTASSAEALALGFIGRPNTKTFGFPSAGHTTSNWSIPLRDGAILRIAFAEMTDRNGKTYPGRVVPDEVTSPNVPSATATNAGALLNDATAQAAIAWLRSLSSCKQ
jgi:carboxyl-terminal processing protease